MISTRPNQSFFTSGAIARSNCAAIAAVALIVRLPMLAFGDQPRAVTADGEAFTGRLTGSAPEHLAWHSPGRSPLRAVNLRRIEFPARTIVTPAGGPLRQIVLRGGDSLAGALLELNERTATLMTGGTGRVTIPRGAMSSVGRMAGLRDVIYVDFERGEHAFAATGARGAVELIRDGDETRVMRVPAGTTVEHMLPDPVESGRVQLRFHDGAAPSSASTVDTVDLEFASSARTHVLRVALGGASGPAVVMPPGVTLTAQNLPRRGGWRGLTVRFGQGRILVLVDGHVLASGTAALGGLTKLRLSGGQPASAGQADSKPAGAAAESQGILIDDVLIQQDGQDTREHIRPPALPSGADLIVLDGGDRLFGTIRRADAHEVEMTGVFGTVRRNWSQVARIVFDSPGPSAGSAAAGLWARVTLQAPTESSEADQPALKLAIQSADDERLLARHEILGDVSLPIREIRGIEPWFTGTRMPLTLDVHHLGDETRADFRRPVPEGPALGGEFALDSVPEGAAFFVADVADLEPSGPETPLGSPFLRELRSGRLVTEAFVNGQRLGRLNDQLRWRAAAGDARRIRIAIPASVLQPGRNHWKIEQTPAGSDPREFDDAEIGPVAIELQRPD